MNPTKRIKNPCGICGTEDKVYKPIDTFQCTKCKKENLSKKCDCGNINFIVKSHPIVCEGCNFPWYYKDMKRKIVGNKTYKDIEGLDEFLRRVSELEKEERTQKKKRRQLNKKQFDGAVLGLMNFLNSRPFMEWYKKENK